jgi:hypothetical protein
MNHQLKSNLNRLKVEFKRDSIELMIDLTRWKRESKRDLLQWIKKTGRFYGWP